MYILSCFTLRIILLCYPGSIEQQCEQDILTLSSLTDMTFLDHSKLSTCEVLIIASLPCLHSPCLFIAYWCFIPQGQHTMNGQGVK
ncbi:hypothetical protein DFH28DRAFT_263569 [Melampsora americana]|nr:hypothetical protein DFH28DRAFT_263569 [Melampsora americana]